MRKALKLAARGIGKTSPNPCVGAVLVRGGVELGAGYHRKAGTAHAEVAAIEDARRRGNAIQRATIYVTLEPCSTTGRTPPCTQAITDAGIARVVVAAEDPNPAHAGRGLRLLKRRGINVASGVLEAEAMRLNEAFNHWIVKGTPFVVAKAAMTLDGKIATAAGESKWITGPAAGKVAMRLRRESDAILVGVNTVLADDPSLTVRFDRWGGKIRKRIRRIVLDSRARTPLNAKVVSDEQADDSIIVVAKDAPTRRVAALAKRTTVWKSPCQSGRISLQPLMKRFGRAEITRLLVEGGGEVHGDFFDSGLVNRVSFFYAPKILGGQESRTGVAGQGGGSLGQMPKVRDGRWQQLGEDLYFTGLIDQT